MFGITIKILRSFAYLVRYALRARRATKALRCFITLTLTLFQIPPLRPKDSGQRKNARGMSARRVITMSVLFRHIFTKQPNPPRPRKSLGWGVWLPARVGLGLKTAVKRDAVLCGATCRKIFVFPTYESVACSVTTQLLTLT